MRFITTVIIFIVVVLGMVEVSHGQSNKIDPTERAVLRYMLDEFVNRDIKCYPLSWSEPEQITDNMTKIRCIFEIRFPKGSPAPAKLGLISNKMQLDWIFVVSQDTVIATFPYEGN